KYILLLILADAQQSLSLTSHCHQMCQALLSFVSLLQSAHIALVLMISSHPNDLARPFVLNVERRQNDKARNDQPLEMFLLEKSFVLESLHNVLPESEYHPLNEPNHWIGLTSLLRYRQAWVESHNYYNSPYKKKVHHCIFHHQHTTAHAVESHNQSASNQHL